MLAIDCIGSYYFFTKECGHIDITVVGYYNGCCGCYLWMPG